MILFIYGTRPEAIKIGPVVAELHEQGESPAIVCTGQHTSLLEGTPAESDLAGGFSLDLASDDNVTRWLTRATVETRNVLQRLQPSLVVVQGDTMSAMAGAKAATGLRIPLAHVEAGVRCGTPEGAWPEEMFRIFIDSVAQWHLASTTYCADNLRFEGVSDETIDVTGNTVVSAMRRYAPDVVPQEEHTATVLITLHRRELRMFGRAKVKVEELVRAAEVYPAYRFVWPMHPAMRAFAPKDPPSNFEVVTPFSYRMMLRQLAGAAGLITDSGGLVEEAATLGVPTAILRAANDRPEAEAAGIARLFPPDTTDALEAVHTLCMEEIPREPCDVFGLPDAARNVATRLLEIAS